MLQRAELIEIRRSSCIEPVLTLSSLRADWFLFRDVSPPRNLTSLHRISRVCTQANLFSKGNPRV